ncbi:hypothetical protein KIY80_gp72 [Mycobacterium phage Benvolio]|uniref:Uncharacterized protein n=1 Tax=Mycobacterium phage Benvolio TaxID=2591074 RepID=A0A514A3Q2_9CAUD|nr:hypothetical protein CH13_gp075 [Mycobacterium phage Echild]YP_010063509.1 hypothetical protein KIY80_gp72 [Mycobacterium phage Benvolio]AHG24296.1 hypothetical protein PBI_ECHILD_75 [Mycobacterium phage Echild]QDH47889.1 hypothetical protein SEA_BENVOLIO_72 [Mycobacterium phage Benvolio]
MALSHIATLFPEVVHTPVETLVNDPEFIYAQRCETWWRGKEHLAPVTVLLVYRSPLVKDTGKFYRPISKMILESNRFEVIGSGSRVDKNYWGNRGDFMVAKMTQASEFPGGPLDNDEMQRILSVATAEALGKVLEAV